VKSHLSNNFDFFEKMLEIDSANENAREILASLPTATHVFDSVLNNLDLPAILQFNKTKKCYYLQTIPHVLAQHEDWGFQFINKHFEPLIAYFEQV